MERGGSVGKARRLSFYVGRETSAKFVLHGGDMKFHKE